MAAGAIARISQVFRIFRTFAEIVCKVVIEVCTYIYSLCYFICIAEIVRFLANFPNTRWNRVVCNILLLH